MATGFTIAQTGNYTADLDDILIRREYFSDGNLWLWGADNYGKLGNNSTTDTASPVQTIAGGTNWRDVACGYYHTAAIKTDGTLWSWGHDNSGQLGDNTTTHKSSPIQTIAGGTNWKQVSTGNYHTAAIKIDGTLWVWGSNSFGQLGDNSGGTTQSSPVQTVSGTAKWAQVSCGIYHTAAIKSDGTLWAWGRNNLGQLGDNTTTPQASPVQSVAGNTNWKYVECGGLFTAAIKTDGTLWMCGYNGQGALGNNTSISTSSPVQVYGGGTNWKQVSAGNVHVAAVKTNGTLWCWGWNPFGQLGDNTTVQKSSPVQTISGGTNWKQVAVGNHFTSAIKTDGTLWSWGNNGSGQLGDNTTGNVKSSPVQTIAGGTNWKQVNCGDTHMAAITDLTF